jgi:F-type H+-transporting ATPase subunit b
VIDLNYSLFIQAGLFILLMLVLNKIFFQPFLRLLEERQGKISGDEQEAARLHEEAERRRRQVDEGLNKGQLLALEEKRRIQDAGAHQGKEIVDTVQQKVVEELSQIKARIADEGRQVAADFERRQGALAQKIAEKILGRGLQ